MHDHYGTVDCFMSVSMHDHYDAVKYRNTFLVVMRVLFHYHQYNEHL